MSNTSNVNSNETVYTTVNVYNTDPDVPKNLHNMMQVLVLEVLSATVCQLSGFDPLNKDGKCLGVDSKTGKIGFTENSGGAIAAMGSLIDATFVPPASSMQYIAYLKNNFGIAKNVYAQGVNPCATDVKGVGFCGLIPVLPVWTTMRNIVYLIFILVFIIIGVGIMLRVHIDPRTVMTIQNQIPKIIVGIIAITFSFAIAGFLIDIMWVTIYLFAGVIRSATAGTGAYMSVDTMIAITQAATPFDAINASYPGDFPIIDIAGTTANAFSNLVVSALSDKFGILNDVIGGLLSVVAFIVIFVAILVALIRLWITLILSYINIIIDVVFAPFWILAGLVPGGPLGLGAWLRDLIANLAVFPVAIGFFMLGSYFVGEFGQQETLNRLTPPLVGGTNPSSVVALIGLGFIFMLPNVLSSVKAALKTPKLNLGPIMGPVSAGLNVTKAVPSYVGTYMAKSPKMGDRGKVTAVTRRLLKF
jgi:hypothetical protein